MKNKKISLEVSNLVIRYRSLKKFSVKKNFLKPGKTKQDSNYYEALKNISFKLNEGDILGVIGTNGAGKSTLLKAIAGIFSPDEGTINLHNNSVSLQAIGVGFQKRLSGYENIYLSGLLLGFTKEEIDNKIDEIIEFCGIGDFIYKPVNVYSSGMQSKLAFAINAILEANIMLVDEVLSVGDVKFRDKSYKKMKELILAEDRTVIIVSHNMNSLRELCDKVLWIEKGEMVKFGDTNEIIDEYLEFTQK